VIAVLGAVVRVALLFFFARVIIRAIAPAFFTQPTPDPPETAIGDLVRDRICKTFFPRERAVRAIIGGEEQLFCSSACADRARLGS